MSSEGKGPAPRGFNRRTVLTASGAALLAPAAAGAPGNRPAPERRPVDPGSGESLIVARHVATARFTDMPPAAIAATRRSILDALGVSMAATGLEPVCRPYVELALAGADLARTDGGGEAVVLGTGGRASLVMAALANGALAHALDYEDAHEASFTHPNAASVAAAVSVADALGGVSGKALIAAVAVGADLVCRLALARGDAGEPPTAFYPPAIAGTFGAAAAASRLLGLDTDATLSAFSLALCMNSTSAQTLFEPYTDIRAVRDGFCAQAGVQGALLAKGGVKGYRQPFEGRGGFFTMYAGGRYLPGVLTGDLGRRYEGERVAYKAWPACRATHRYIQAVLEAEEQAPIDVERIEAIHANVSASDLIVCEPAAEKRRPRAAIDAKFSLYYTVAAALRGGGIDFGSFGDDAISDPRTLALADRISYVVDERRSRPGAEGGGPLLVVRFRDGSERALGVDRVLGTPENPIPQARLAEKFVDCGLSAAKPGDRATLRALADAVLGLEDVSEVRDVIRRL